MCDQAQVQLCYGADPFFLWVRSSRIIEGLYLTVGTIPRTAAVVQKFYACRHEKWDDVVYRLSTSRNRFSVLFSSFLCTITLVRVRICLFLDNKTWSYQAV